MKFDSKSNVDFLTPPQRESLQLELLKKQLHYTLLNSPFYKDKFTHHDIESISRLSDYSTFIKTSKKELAENNVEFLSISQREVVEYVTTSGTTGKPVKIALSRNDQERLGYNEARSLSIAGFSAEDLVQITTTLDKGFMAGMAYYLGLSKIGSAIFRAGQGTPEFHWGMIRQINPTALIAVPSFLEKLGSHASRSPHRISKALCIGDPLRNADFSPNSLSNNIAKDWNLDLRSTYASTEMATAFTECEAKQGGHLLPELIILEILDKQGNEVADGEIGEITVTPLGIEAMPLVRFQTGDLARKHSKPCSCGRNTPRLGPIEGRLAQMIKWKGTTLYPTQLEQVLYRFPSANPYVIELDLDVSGLDSVCIILPESCPDQEVETLLLELQAQLRVKPLIKKSTISAIQNLLFRENSRKPKKVIDYRNV